MMVCFSFFELSAEEANYIFLLTNQQFYSHNIFQV